jgi:hypothetical protein
MTVAIVTARIRYLMTADCIESPQRRQGHVPRNRAEVREKRAARACFVVLRNLLLVERWPRHSVRDVLGMAITFSHLLVCACSTPAHVPSRSHSRTARHAVHWIR